MKTDIAIGTLRGGIGNLKMNPAGLTLPAAILLMMAGFSVMGDGYLSAGNIWNIANQTTYLTIFACAQMLVLLVRGLDLSIGHTASTVSVASALIATGGLLPQSEASMVASIAGGLGVALLIGVFNGVGVAYLRVNPFVTTLASFNICFGIASMLSDGRPVGGVPSDFSRIFYGAGGTGLSVPIMWTLALVLILYVLLGNTRLGRAWYLIGGNPRAAVLAGLPTKRATLYAYVACSLVAGFGALMLTARTGSGEPNLGGEIMLQSIAAAAIGGVSLRGGNGGVMAAVMGAFFITVLANGMNFLQINGYLQQICLGLVIVAAVSLDRRR